MRHAFILGILLCLSVLGTQYSADKQWLRVCGNLGQETHRALVHGGISFHQEPTMLVIDASDKERLLNVLCRVLQGYQQSIELAKLNLRNANTTRSEDGSPYRRREIILNADGTAGEVIVSPLDFLWVYSPSHPDAVKQGPKAGYVAKPNVDPEMEEKRIEELQMGANVLRSMISQLDPTLIVPENIRFATQLYGPESTPFTLPEPNQLQNEGPHFALRPREDGAKGLFPSSVPCHPLKTSNSVSCGQTAVAVSLNSLSDASLTDSDIDRFYGFQLLNALKTESEPLGYYWYDAGDLDEGKLDLIKSKVEFEHLPVIVALNGPEFSPSGRGEILTIVDCKDDLVTFVDSSEGVLKTTTWQSMLKASAHPDGNFVFVAEKIPMPSSKIEGYKISGFEAL